LLAVYAIGEWTPLFGGHQGLAAIVWGFFVSTLLSLQGSLMVNAFAHSSKTGWFTYRSYRTGDASLNNWLLSLLSLGASWHNNHHHYMNSARTGFRWWELDLTYLTLRVLSLLGLVWDLQEVPRHIAMQQGDPDARLEGAPGKPVGSRTIEHRAVMKQSTLGFTRQSET
jgi:stearoyl-CoA desaturase (Delta-9 desaturase)